MSSNLPVIFLAFANEQQGGRYLKNVVNEQKELDAILKSIDANRLPENSEQALCKVVIRANANISEIIEVFNDFKDQIAIFHYGGHADGYQLLLEGKDGESQVAKGSGLVPILASKKNLKLVFLNGCSTQRLARDLADQGVPVVIGTSSSIADNLALDISKRFYTGLSVGHTMAGAWEEAKNEAKSVGNVGPAESKKGSAHRGIKNLPGDRSANFPWEEEFSKTKAGQEVFENWNLPEEAKNPLRFLPKPKEATLPAEPFLFLKPYEAQHAEIFFGRSRYIQELYLKISEPVSPPIVLLYGESGSGKSSLLDAGIRPRLEVASSAAKPNQPLFEVRYERRDQDLGLVGTLAKMLQYQPQEVSPAKSDKTDSLANEQQAEVLAKEMERLQRMEVLAKELEEEKTRYTLLSIIDRYRDLQTNVSTGVVIDDLYFNGQLAEGAGIKLRNAWKAMEKETGSRLVIILDQVEELFSRPHAEQRQELEDLLDVLRDIFSTTPQNESDRIKGKIVLGYREEFNAKIEARVKEKELSRTSVFLEQLTEDDVHDIFRGLQRGRAKAEYNIQVEERLPSLVVNHLMDGKSAVAPVLQLLLTKLWRYTYPKNPGTPYFSVQAFQDVQSQGGEMEEYFMTQMKKMVEWNPDVVESGLALDILHFHVSDLGTSNRRSIETIEQRYKHLPEEFDYPKGFIAKLVDKLKSPDVFLLNDLGRGFTSLPHDTLAPIIIREYNRSDKYGQRSARILDTKAPDLVRALAAGETELKKLRLDDNDLEVIQEGKRGMRALQEREQKLLEISLEEREKRMRLRRVMIQGGIVLGLFILVLSLLAGSLSFSMVERIKNSVAISAHETSQIEQEKRFPNHLESIKMAHFAYRESEPKRIDVVKNIYQLYEQYGLRDSAKVNAPILSMDIKTRARISSWDYYPTIGSLVSLEDTTVQFWPTKRGEEMKTLRLTDYFYEEELKELSVGFSANGKEIQVRSREYQSPIFFINKQLRPSLRILLYGRQSNNDYLYYDEEYQYDDDEVYIDDYQDDTEDIPLYLGYYDLFTGEFFFDIEGQRLSKREFMDNYSFLLGGNNSNEFLDDQQNQISVDTLFRFHLWNAEKNELNVRQYNDLLVLDWGEKLITAYNNNYIENLNGKQEEKPKALSLTKLPDTTTIELRATQLSYGTENISLLWNLKDTAEFEGGYYAPDSLFYLTSLSENRFLVVDNKRNVKIQRMVDFDLKKDSLLLASTSELMDIAISPDHQHIMAMTNKDSIFIWDLRGRLTKKFTHPNVKRYAFSPDGTKLLTQSTESVSVWSSQQEDLSTFINNQEAFDIVLARFHQGLDKDKEHLILGLAQPAKFPENKKIKREKSQIVLWNIWNAGEEPVVFEAPEGVFQDATISANREFAVVTTREGANIIPSPDFDNKKPVPVNSFIEAKDDGASSQVSISAGGKYIVHETPQERKLELYATNGALINAYSFQNGFIQGVNGQLFTPDDLFLIGSKSNEVLLLQPESKKNGKVLTWGENYELNIEEKESNNLATFMDYMPGTKLPNKNWAIGVMMIALIFILLYFSDFVIRFLQRKSYLQLALYSAAFFLLSLAAMTLWSIGAYEPETKRAAFYFIVLTTLAILFAAIVATWGTRKYNLLIPLIVVSVVIILGGIKFFHEESKQHQAAFLKEVRRDYNIDKSSKDFYRALYKSNTIATAGRLELDDKKLAEVVKNNKTEVKDRVGAGESEWPNLLGGLLAALFFGLIIAYPIHRAIKLYEKEEEVDWAFYRWLFLPMVCSIIAIWIVCIMIDEYDTENAIGNILNLTSGLIFLLVVIRQSRLYLKTKHYSNIALYGLLTAAISSIFLVISPSIFFVLPLALTFILGRQYRQRGNFGMAFTFFSIALFLITGFLFWDSIYSLYSTTIEGLFLATLLLIPFLAVRWGLNKVAFRKREKNPLWGKALAKGLFIGYIVILLGLSPFFSFIDHNSSLIIATTVPLIVVAALGISWQEKLTEKQNANKKVFNSNRIATLALSLIITLTVLGLGIGLIEQGGIIFFSFPLAALLVLIFYGLRQQLSKMIAKKATNGNRWVNRFAILGLFILGIVSTMRTADEINWATAYNSYYGEDVYYEEGYEAYGNEENAYESNGVEDNYGEGNDEAATDNDVTLEEEIDSKPDADFAAARQQLINDLFNEDETVRNEALAALKASAVNSPSLVSQLIKASYDNLDRKNGRENVLDLLERQSDAVLQQNANALATYLKDYFDADTSGRIQLLLERID